METVDPKAKIGNMIQSRVLKFELLILSVVALIFILRLLNIPYSGIISTLVLMSVSVIYFFSAFASPAKEFSPTDFFFYKLSALGCSVSVIGALFRIQHWPNNKTMITIGLATMLLSLAYIIYQNNRVAETEKFNKLIIIRLIVLIILSAGTLFSDF